MAKASSVGQQGDKVKTKRIGKTREKAQRHGKRWSKVDIRESPEELRLAMINNGDSDPRGLVASRLRLLLLLKTGAVPSAAAAQRKIGVTWTTVSKWLKIYSESGLAGLLSIDSGGRPSVSSEHQKLIQEMTHQGLTVDQIVERLTAQGVELSRWTVYKQNSPQTKGKLWQCKTTAAMDATIEAFAASPAGQALGGWFKTESDESPIRYNIDLVQHLIEVGMKAKTKQPVLPRRAWGRPGAAGSHIGFWLSGDRLEAVEQAAKRGESHNQTIRRLLETGLIAEGFLVPPEDGRPPS